MKPQPLFFNLFFVFILLLSHSHIFSQNTINDPVKDDSVYTQEPIEDVGQPKITRKKLKFFHRRLEKSLQTYYQNPSDSILAYTVELFNCPPVIYESYETVLKGFFGSLFATDSSKKEEFKRSLDKFEREDFKSLFEQLLTKPFEDIINEHPLDKTKNDLLWAAFYCSGSSTYLESVLGNCKDWDNEIEKDKFLMSGTALWSMASNYDRNIDVKQFIDSKKGNKYARKIRRRSPKYLYKKTKKVADKRFVEVYDNSLYEFK